MFKKQLFLSFVTKLNNPIMKHKINNTWKENMAFEAEVEGFKITLDADAAVGGEGRGPKPKALTLVSLAGVTTARKFRGDRFSFSNTSNHKVL